MKPKKLVQWLRDNAHKADLPSLNAKNPLEEAADMITNLSLQVKGYSAANIIVKDRLDEATKLTPRRLKPGYEKQAGYRKGIVDGLMFAHCQSSLGEYPTFNADAIQAVVGTEKDGQSEPK